MAKQRPTREFREDGFDYGQLAGLYRSLRWKWKGHIHGIPTADDLRSTYEWLLSDLREFDSVGTGGIYATKVNGVPFIRLHPKLDAVYQEATA